MKKFLFSLAACAAMVQSAFAATSALTESLLEYEAITNAIGTNPDFENIIPPDEFIIDIKRLTRRIDVLGEVKYGILARTVTDGDEWDCRHEHPCPIRYIATLNVAANPGIGPNIITVESIVLAEQHHHHHHH